jgi:hypothetical protein
LEDILREVNARYRDRVIEKNDVLIAAKLTDPKMAGLRYIDPNGAASAINDYKAIGHGAPYGEAFLKRLWRTKNSLTMNQVGQLGYFIIKYIESFGLDRTVSVGDDKPQIWFLPDQSEAHEASEDTFAKYEEWSKLSLVSHTEHLNKLIATL